MGRPAWNAAFPGRAGEDTSIYKSRWPEAEVATSYTNPAGNLASSGLPSDANALVGQRLKPTCPRPISLYGLPKFFIFLWTGGPTAPALPA